MYNVGEYINCTEFAMNKITKALICTMAIWGGAAIELHAQEGVVVELGQQLEDKQQEVKYLEQEIGFAQLRRKASQEKLKAYEKDLEDKQDELKKAQLRYSGDPSSENEQFLRNIEQRIELAELSIKSRVASVVRLETKERELTEKLADYREELKSLSGELHKQQLAQKVAQKTRSLKTELESQTTLLQKRLTTLQRENERLRQVVQLETEKREQAEERATLAEERARSAELALTQYHQANSLDTEDVVAEEGSQGARERAQAEMDRVREKLAAGEAGGASVNLHLKGDDGTEYGMFQYLGAQQYRADAVIHDSISRFRVAGRTYQVKVSDEGLGEEFVFLYDMTDSDKPRFVTFKKSLLDAGGVVAKE